MSLKVYTKTVCSQCAPIKSILKSKNIEHELVNVDENPEALEYLFANNYRSMPVLILNEGENQEVATGLDGTLAIMKWSKEGLI